MRLRSITKHVRDQNWFAVVLDFFIVVIGVFIGLQVSNWNSVRQQDQTAKVYIERIHQDLVINQDDLTQRMVYFSQVRTHALGALEGLDRPQETLSLPFLIDIYQASQHLRRELGRDTYDEILSAGANNTISDVAVRKRLANFYRSIQAAIVTTKDATPYRERIRTYMPYSAQAAIRNVCNDIISTSPTGEPNIKLPENCEPVLSADEITHAVGKIISIDIRNDLVRRISDLDGKLIAFELMRGRAALLDEYIKDIQK
ncbi:MAG: hypothetical protein COC03_05055 [Robiginitomaculum sp.]|nr:MAG: hypothetical protein COC03_05055 [Robiginitomaculum sp.]PHQ66723.1 MAG: hypothetical protein COB92_06850 [Robiginitomaculum sp.]